MADKEYIERGAFLRKCAEAWGHYGVTIKAIEGIADECAAADVVEVRHGEWKKRGNEKKCSVCDFIYYSNNDEWTYCPNCGAKMDGERKEQT